MLLLTTLLSCRHPAATPGVLPPSPQHRSVSSGGVEIHYRVFGQGPPLVVINGGPGVDSRGFEGLAEALSTTHTVVLYDQRGTGDSTVSPVNEETITLETYMADLEAIRHDLELTRWHVLGHSFGGLLACGYLVQHPTSIDRLIFSSSAGFDLSLFQTDHIGWIESQLTPDELTSLRSLQAAYHAGDHSDALLVEHAALLAGAYLVSDEHTALIAGRLYRSRPDIGQLLQADLHRIRFDSTDALASFASPALIIQGAEDVMDPDMAHRQHALMPDAELVILEHCGHYGWLDQPEAWLSTVETFLLADQP